MEKYRYFLLWCGSICLLRQDFCFYEKPLWVEYTRGQYSHHLMLSVLIVCKVSVGALVPSRPARPVKDVCEWTQYHNTDGRCYYYNSHTMESVWHKPKAFMEWQGAGCLHVHFVLKGSPVLTSCKDDVKFIFNMYVWNLTGIMLST